PCTRALDLPKYSFQLSQPQHLLPERGQPGRHDAVSLTTRNEATLQGENCLDLLQIETGRLCSANEREPLTRRAGIEPIVSRSPARRSQQALTLVEADRSLSNPSRLGEAANGHLLSHRWTMPNVGVECKVATTWLPPESPFTALSVRS